MTGVPRRGDPITTAGKPARRPVKSSTVFCPLIGVEWSACRVESRNSISPFLLRPLAGDAAAMAYDTIQSLAFKIENNRSY